MYGRKVFQILQKKGIPTEDKFNYGTNEHPNAEIYQSAHSRRLLSFSWIHTIDGVKHTLVENGPVFIALPLYNSSPTFWKSGNDQAHDFHVASIEGYNTNGFFFRNSWGLDWGNNGCGYLPFIDWSRVVEAWVGVSRRALVDSTIFEFFVILVLDIRLNLVDSFQGLLPLLYK